MRARILLPLLCALAFPAGAEALRGPVSLENVIVLAQSGISDETILAFLEPRQVAFDLDADEIARLKEAGVSEEIIRYLLEKAGAPPRETGASTVVVVPAYPYSSRYYWPYYVFGTVLHLGGWIYPHRWDHHLAPTHTLARVHHREGLDAHTPGGHRFSEGRGVHYSGHSRAGHRGRLLHHSQGHSAGGHATAHYFGQARHGATHSTGSHSGRSHHRRGGHGGHH